jgi:hypothetical protein
VAVVLAGQWIGGQSLTYSRGQNISPAYEGWEQNADGSFSLLFGYMNRNWEEEIDVPVGPDNDIEPGGPDQAQPTHFLPRRNRFIFKVRVPKDFGQKEMVWTLTTKGKTEKAYATLRTDYLLENVDLMSETGALGAGTSNPEVRADQPPVIKLDGEKTRTARVGQPLTLVAWVTDDGIPKPRFRGRTNEERAAEIARLRGDEAPRRNPAMIPPSRVTVGKTLGLHLSWFVYRGAGRVRLDPPQIKVWEDTRTGANSPWAPLWTPPQLPPDDKWVAMATFDEPGTYLLRARADDGALTTDENLTVNVAR